MNLEQKINDEIKAAMLARNPQKLEALRAIKAALLLEKTKEDAESTISEGTALKILQKLVKQRRESAEIYANAQRDDLAQKELFEASIIETFLPQQLSAEEVTAVITRIIEQTGAASVKDMGKVMGAASKELAGKADNKMISEIVKMKLQPQSGT
ncbi:MAG TPA: GatB/YqeY domain-containing protein [Bacteroidales bacterium]|nr:GatB/YqeY domain-containing protein [Bacteroidales bacterium]